MKRFIEVLLESKDRFVLKNKLLTSDQQKYIIDNIRKYKKFEQLINSQIGWQKVHKVDYETLINLLGIATDTKTSKKRSARKLRHKGIKGLKEGDDYITIKTRNPYYLSYLPLNYKAAQVIKTTHIGGCIHNGCIGGSQASIYFRREGKAKKRVPVYVIGMGEKYVVMMYPDNKSNWEVWAKENKFGEKGEVIPNFSIKKELTTNSLMELYKDVLYNKWGRVLTSNIVPQDEYDDAIEAYDEMKDDIELYIGEKQEILKEYNENNDKVLKDSIVMYKEKIEELEQYLVKIDNSRDRIKEKLYGIKKIMEVEPSGTGTNSQGEVVWNLRGVDYTMDELIRYHKETMRGLDAYDDKKEYLKNAEDIDTAMSILDSLESMDQGWEFEEWVENNSGVELDGEIILYEYIFEGMYRYISFSNSSYDDYFEFAEAYMDIDVDDRYELDSAFYEIESDYTYQNDVDGEEVLENLSLPHPENHLGENN